MYWTKTAETPFKAGFRRMLTRTFSLPNGTSDDFTIKNEGSTVCVLALTEQNEVILAKQFRPGPEDVLLELPGGGLKAGESAIEAAIRELLEETGYAGEIRHVTTCLDCGYSNMKRECFIATNCKKVGEQQLDDTEFIDVVLMSLPSFREHLRSGQLTDVEVGYLGLDKLGLL
ncbi:MAG: NUDIX hydrolase [Patescibacteria group bacterium]